MHEKNKIGVIAHDFIGAVRGIDRFTDYGINPTLVIDEKVSEECDVIAINTNSKITSPKNAYLQTRKAIINNQSRYLYFYESKYLMGNISSDVKAILDVLQPEKLIFCNTWLEQGIYIKGAYSYINNIPLNKAPNATDEVTPIKESYVPSILEKHTGIKANTVSLSDVERGVEHVIKVINSSNSRIIVCDSTNHHHLNTIAEAVIRNRDSWIACGSAGLIRAMTPLFGYRKERNDIDLLPGKEPALLVLGSLGDVTAVQLTAAAKGGLVHPILIEPADFWHRKKREYLSSKYAEEAGNQLAKGETVAISSTVSRFVPQFRIVAAYILSQVAKLIVDTHSIHNLLISGSDTADAFCRTLGVQKLVAKGSITGDTNSIVTSAYGSNGREYWLCLKPGSSGNSTEIPNMAKLFHST